MNINIIVSYFYIKNHYESARKCCCNRMLIEECGNFHCREQCCKKKSPMIVPEKKIVMNSPQDASALQPLKTVPNPNELPKDILQKTDLAVNTIVNTVTTKNDNGYVINGYNEMRAKDIQFIEETCTKSCNQASRCGLLHYRKWWELIEVEILVNGKLITGIPIFTEENTLRVINNNYSYFIPLEKVDYIRTNDGLRSPFDLSDDKAT